MGRAPRAGQKGPGFPQKSDPRAPFIRPGPPGHPLGVFFSGQFGKTVQRRPVPNFFLPWEGLTPLLLDGRIPPRGSATRHVAAPLLFGCTESSDVPNKSPAKVGSRNGTSSQGQSDVRSERGVAWGCGEG